MTPTCTPPNPHYEKTCAHLDTLIAQCKAAKLAGMTLAEKLRFDRAARAAESARALIRKHVFDFEDAAQKG